MAAAEYYNGGGGLPTPPTSHPAPSQRPPQQQLHPQQASELPYPISDAPPPYTAYADPRPHSQPPPQQRPAHTSGAPPATTSQPHNPPEKYGFVDSPPIQNMYRPQDFHPNNGGNYPSAPPPQSFYPSQAGPAMQQVYGGSSGNNSYSNSNNNKPNYSNSTNNLRPSSSPASGRPQGSYNNNNNNNNSTRNRSRSRSRSRPRRHRHEARPAAPRKKSSGVNTFLGAGGGALIGDAIFPGLGTLGGALLGGLGGHEYSKRRSQSHPHRTRDRAYSNDGDYYYEGERRRERR